MTFRSTKRRANLALFACDFCKHRKIRCTLVGSQCKECLVRGLHCTFLKSSERKCYQRGQLQEKKEWKDKIIVWSITSDKSEGSRPMEEAYEPNEMQTLFGSRASELTSKELKVLEESVSNPTSSSLASIKEKLHLMVAVLDKDKFRFLVNTMVAWHLFTSAENQKSLASDSSEFTDGITYYSNAVEAIPFMDIEDMTVLPVLTLLEEVRVISERVVT